jgi:hypothetical protein
MNSIFGILRWGLRIYAFYIALTNPDIQEGSFQSYLFVSLFFELIASWISLARFEKDEMFQVVTGFFGNVSYGHFEKNDHSLKRFFGYIGLVFSWIFRFMLFGTLLNGEVPVGEISSQTLLSLFL